jgi:hypothetical protein
MNYIYNNLNKTNLEDESYGVFMRTFEMSPKESNLRGGGGGV